MSLNDYLAADQLLQITNQNRLIAELMAEVAALKARTAMAWRRREDVGEYYEGDRFLVAIHIRSTAGGTERFYWDFACVRVGDYGNLLTADGDDWGWRFADVDFVIPITDLTPPGGEDAS